MSDYHRSPTYQSARKEHLCIYCYGPIFVGEMYANQTGYYNGSAYRNRFHIECFEDCAEEANFGCDEFTPGRADWPDRVREAVEVRNKTNNAECSGAKRPTCTPG